MQQPDHDQEHHYSEDDRHVAEPGRVGGDERGGGVEGERDGEAADGDALSEEEPAASRAETQRPAWSPA